MTDSLNVYLNKWGLDDAQPLANTFTSTLYRVRQNSETAVLKILSDIGAEDERGGAALLKWYDGDGAVKLLASDDGAMLLEYADGDDLTPLVKAGRDDEATKIIAGVLNRLHLTERGKHPDGLIPLRVRFRSLLDDNQNGDPILAHGALIAKKLLSDDVPVHVLHGDIHHENIRGSARGWLAIDPKGLIGDRTYDAANTLCNPHTMQDYVQNPDRLKRQGEIMAGETGMSEARLLSYVFAHACLCACWCMEDGVEPSHSFAMARIAKELMPA